MREKLLEKEEILSKTTHIFTRTVTLQLEFSVSAGANQPPCFSVCGKLAPNWLI